jgi:hypothetical protein
MFEKMKIITLNIEPVAKISHAQIDKIVKKDFGKRQYAKIIRMLSRYKSETDSDNYRVWAAILKLSESRISRLESNIKMARSDFRDVITSAEYPEYSQCSFSGMRYFSRKMIFLRDWNQYKKWLSSYK